MYVPGSSSSGRVTGMSSGMDVDATVTDLMRAEMYEYNRVTQNVQIAEWEMEAYRSVSEKLTEFEETYFDFTNQDSNMLSPTTFNMYEATSTDTAVSVTLIDGSKANNHEILVNQLAQAANYETNSNPNKSVQGTEPIDYTLLEGTMELTLDDVTRSISLDGLSSYTDLQDSINTSFGSGKISVSEGVSGVVLDIVDGSGVSVINITSTDETTLTLLGFGEDSIQSNRLMSSMTLETVSNQLLTPFTYNTDDEIEFIINGESFTFEKSSTLSNMIETVNASEVANVTMSYNQLAGTFSIESKSTGAGNTLEITETDSNFLDALNMSYTPGQDAEVMLDGELVVRSENDFKVDGMIIQLNDVTTEPVEVKVTEDIEEALMAIVDFVDAYNTLIEDLRSTIDENADSDYAPLTDEERDALSTEEIEKWESVAKIGLLEDDPLIYNMLTDMRQALMSLVSFGNISLFDIGISTQDYTDGGKLIIDETVLRQALESNPEDIVDLFTKASESHPGTTSARSLTGEEKSVRFEEEGLMYKIYDILEQNVSKYRNLNGDKGLLVEKGGITNDVTEFDNYYSDIIDTLNDEKDDLETALYDKEDAYYARFTAMEQAILEMNAQMESLYSMSGG